MKTTTRANFLPEQRFIPLRPALERGGQRPAGHDSHVLAVREHGVPGARDPGAGEHERRKLLRCAGLAGSTDRIGADEGSIWLLDEEKKHLVVAYNSGPNTDSIVGFKQPLGKGIVSLVVASENAFVENQGYKNAKHSATLDKKLHKTTYAMIAVPFYFLNQVRGVISCVQLLDVMVQDGEAAATGTTPAGFGPHELNAIQTISAVIRDLIDYRMLGTAVGWNRS